MDRAAASPFPHLSWLGTNLHFQPANGPWCVNWHSQCHSICLTLNRPYSVRWIHRGREIGWRSDGGTVHFMPCDGRQHVLLTHADDPCDFFIVFVPRRHITQISHAEGLDCSEALHRLLIPHDPILRRAMYTLSTCRSSPSQDQAHADEAARRLVLRLVELSGGGTPDWTTDASVFDRRTMHHLVEYLDANLRVTPSVGDLGRRVGLSPSHFARKFRHSTGLSLARFVNRRRILASLETLTRDSVPLADVALDLGFSSQSHFTRLFGDLTGMTPAKYRKSFRRIVG